MERKTVVAIIISRCDLPNIHVCIQWVRPSIVEVLYLDVSLKFSVSDEKYKCLTVL